MFGVSIFYFVFVYLPQQNLARVEEEQQKLVKELDAERARVHEECYQEYVGKYEEQKDLAIKAVGTCYGTGMCTVDQWIEELGYEIGSARDFRSKQYMDLIIKSCMNRRGFQY